MIRKSLRGPQFEAAWADELGKWRYADAAWDQLQFGLRLGAQPREVVTTTPRAIPLLKRMLADERIALTRARTQDNADNLAPAFLDAVVGRYAGTRLGRQELDGDLIEDRADALWTRDLLERARREVAPDLRRIVVAVDPPASSRGGGRMPAGSSGSGSIRRGSAMCWPMKSASGLKPNAWAAKATMLYRRLEADALVVEVNQGGEMATDGHSRNRPGLPGRAGARVARESACAPSRSRCSNAQDRVRHIGGCFPSSKTRCATSGSTGCPTVARRTASMPWSGRWTHLALGPKGWRPATAVGVEGKCSAKLPSPPVEIGPHTRHRLRALYQKRRDSSYKGLGVRGFNEARW